ncbi:fungal-specific transcription factor domain-containing protein [Dactylonectria macrodidyma]|uniref:Fungal-specific transcription factor domain-containing protein n=1 Tax=Dactylonectria macrodidyma TaxID=307937 RepID=A0A9P9IJB3_9HYPO|nr:fungal-specific transcription factor domain-containing protein [Dactylonectria macrodidyma]
MSQVKAPREFKFVGAYSRKRRRKNGTVPNGVSRNLIAGATTPQPAPTPARAPTSSPKAISEKEIDREKPASSTPPASTNPAETQPPEDLETPLLCEGAVDLTGSEMLLNPPAETISHDNSIDWSYSNLMNPFLDPGPLYMAPFDQLGGHHQLPIYFGPDVPLIQLDENSSTDNSPQNGIAGPALPTDGDGVRIEPGTTADHSTIDEIVIPSLNSQEAPCNISLTITQLLTRYDQEFCVIPLTHDFDANPFRFDAETGRGSQLLLHCILALSYKHLNRDTGSCADEAKSYKKKALQMLRDMESVSDASPLGASFLDAVLILMTLDCATSAHGPWVWYLKRAHKIIQATEPLNVKKTPRMQARIEMLVWWDVTLALTSRQGCVFSESTIISLFNHDADSNETFYSVSGCPEVLFRHIIRLGSYAREYELVANMTCAKFDMGPVLELESKIREWKDPEYSDFDDHNVSDSSAAQGCDPEDVAHYKEDLHHCAEAWRYSLLIYIARVFKWQRDQPAPPVLGFLARKTLNHVSSCRYTSMLQKQLLLPVFLAGCETADEHLRQVASTYCSWWNERTRYDMFLTANALLEEVWSNASLNAWWGSIMDQKSRSSVGSGDARQYLFG